jgi:hypothetical protein
MTTREEWLEALVEQLTPWYEKDVPPVRISVGFTSQGKRSKRIGECWSKECDGEGHCQIFIHPQLDDPLDIAATVAHELIHAVVGTDAKHGAPFKRVALKIGLQGPMRSTTPSEGFKTKIAPILEDLGPLPHSALKGSGGSSAPKKQTTRMLKCECQGCGYVVRTTRQWIDLGLPVCGVCGEVFTESV